MELNQFRNVDVVLDKANDNFIQKQFVSSGDKDGRSLTVQITENGVIGEIIGATLNLYWHNEASGLTDLSAFYVVDKATSVFKIDYPQNMLTPGKVIAYIQILHGGKVTHTKPFEITVQNLAGTTRGVLATAEYGALVTTLAKANEFSAQLAHTETELTKKPNKNETGWATLNSFDEPTRAVIQGIAPGEINAVLGERNVHPENTTFFEVEHSVNILDVNTITKDHYINQGGSIEPYDGYFVTKKESVRHLRGRKIFYSYLSGAVNGGRLSQTIQRVNVYGDDGATLLLSTPSNIESFVIPEDASHIVVSLSDSRLNQQPMLELDEVRQAFVPYYRKDVLNDEHIKGLNALKISVDNLKNGLADGIRVVKGVDSYSICYSSKGGKYLVYDFKLNQNPTINVNVWQIWQIRITDGDLNTIHTISSGNDVDGVIRIDGETDYVGGVHGDEQQTSMYVLADGQIIDLVKPLPEWVEKISFIVESSVYRQESDQLAFIKRKIVSFEKNGVHIKNQWIPQIDLLIYHVRGVLLSIEKESNGERLVNHYMDSNVNIIPKSIQVDSSGTLENNENIKDFHISGDVISAKIAIGDYGESDYKGILADFGTRIKPYMDTYRNYNATTGEVLYTESHYSINVH